jgi:hypothetical protein
MLLRKTGDASSSSRPMPSHWLPFPAQSAPATWHALICVRCSQKWETRQICPYEKWEFRNHGNHAKKKSHGAIVNLHLLWLYHKTVLE